MTIQVLILLCTFVAGFLLIFGINLVVTDVHRSDQQERRIEMLNEVRSQLQVRAKESVAHNAGLLWPRNSFLKHPGKVTVVIGAPIDSAGHTPEELMRKVEDWIEAQVEILVRPERADAA